MGYMGSWHSMATVAHVAVCRAGGGGHESGLAARCEEYASETSQDGPLEEMIGTNPGFDTKE